MSKLDEDGNTVDIYGRDIEDLGDWDAEQILQENGIKVISDPLLKGYSDVIVFPPKPGEQGDLFWSGRCR